MKQFLLLCALASFIKLSSQSFTNGTVFDYSVGDTIVTYKQNKDAFGNVGPPTTTYRVYTNKYYSANLDTVFYQAHDVYSTPPPTPPYFSPFPISSANVSFFVSNLGSSAINFSLPWIHGCQTMIDTSYVNMCGMNEHFKYAKNDSSCFEPPTIEYKIVEGVGVFENTMSWNGIPFSGGTKTTLNWFRKGNKRCGFMNAIPVENPTGIEEWNSSVEKLQIYPNPSKGIYNINTSDKGTVFVMNVLGEEVYTAQIERGISVLNLENQTPGIYIVKCKSGDKVFVGRVVKE
ncbi:T9SS type A sorting domain-containing protein [Aurantibacillus circumpalustris]|uniref:T9SS type A sorting domain-containing protein n=1 Tax=Aurantibacillus circumpalustris TaxID=3036359 RepID=UPI00295BC08D|nr:T9SS type A sorting domain-containing protein [Aurantibacillus circumpalustris]